MSTGVGRPKRDHWAQRKDNNVSISQQALAQFLRDQADEMKSLRADLAQLRGAYDGAQNDLATLRATHAEVLGTVREFVQALITAMGDDDAVGEYSWIMVWDSALSGTNRDRFTRSDKALVSAIRALVALAEVPG